MSRLYVVVEPITLSSIELAQATGGWSWKQVGEYAAPLLMANPVTMPLGFATMNKRAAAYGAVGAAGGAIAGSPGGLPGAAAGAAGGGLVGYYGALLSRDLPVK